MAQVHVGVSGWSYDSWRNGAFFPEGLPRRRELEYLTRRFNSVEINGSFYSLLTPQTYENYRDTAPDGFLYAVKGSRFITHAKKLRNVETPLANFLASGVLRLEDKLGPLLWQFPEMAWEVARVESFLELLPRDTEEAAKLARKHDDRVKGRSSLAVHRRRRIRHALEFRSEHFLTAEVVRLCRRHGVALVFADSGDWPYVEEITAGFVYVRLHGSPRTYASSYSGAALDDWAHKVRRWAAGDEPPRPRRVTDRRPPRRKHRTVYVYFDNDHHAHAPRNARALAERLGVESPGVEAAVDRRESR
ncbi:MAG: DUF72 domain-containing protein [Candidatus Krumholzibacteriia bacterium]